MANPGVTTSCTGTVYECPPNQNWTLSGTTCTRPDTKDSGPPSAPDGSQPSTCYPITIGTGNKWLVEVDVAGSGGRGVLASALGLGADSLGFTRTYNSNPGTVSSVMGVRWRMDYGQRLGFYSGSNATVWSYRPDGKTIKFVLTGGAYTADADVADRLYADTSNGGAYRLHLADLGVERYDSAGRLLSISRPNGSTFTLTYDAAGRLTSVADAFGRSLVFAYDANSRLSSLTTPDGVLSYGHDATGNLTGVTYPDGKTKTYHYNEPANTGGANLPHALTGITDENDVRYITYRYDSTGRAVGEVMAGGVGSNELAFAADQTTLTDALGTPYTYTYQNVLGVTRNTGVSQPGGAGCGPASSAIAYDVNGNVTRRTDFNGNVTTYAYDLTRNLETSRTEASGTPLARTTSTAWHPYWRQPVKVAEPKKVTTYTYNGDGGVLCAPADATVPSTGGGSRPIEVVCKRSEQATTDETGAAGLTPTVTGLPRTWTYTYERYGQVLTANGPRNDVADVTSYAYYDASDADLGRRGRLATIANALGQVTMLSAYDASGRPSAITDPNGAPITLGYTPRGRIATRSVDGQTTSYHYTPWGDVERVDLPDGTSLQYEYDAAHRLIGLSDPAGRGASYTLDAQGKRTVDTDINGDGSTARQVSRSYDALGRIQTEAEGDDPARSFAYFANGELQSVNSPRQATTSYTIDALGRTTHITDPINGNGKPTAMAYDRRGQITSLTAPNGAVTSFTVDGLGNVRQENSANRGTTSATYDEAGNLKTRTDARGVTTSIAYDALNRPTTVTTSNGRSRTLTYDGCANGLGRLCRVVQGELTVDYAYDRRGNPTSVTRRIGTETFTTSLVYNGAERLLAVTAPTGETIASTLDAGGAIAGLDATRGGAPLVLAEQIVHDARGQVLSLRAGQITIAQTYDAAGRLETGPDLDLAYADGQLAQRSTPSGTSSYTYDALDRLEHEAGPAGARQHAYDPNGNRATDGAAPPTVAAFAPNSDRLATLNGVAATHDAAGNLIGYGQMYYDDFGDLVEVRKSDQTLLATYTYDENHRRIRKVTTAAAAHGAGTTYYHYLPDGRLLAETTPGNQPQATYIWNGPTLTGFITYNPRTLHTVQVDQLGSPYQIRSLAGQVLWRWESEGYGGTAPNEDVDGDGTRLVFNPRFPGQYYDKESGLHYNGHRYYHPRLGRYISSDPIGVAGGVNTYAYVEGNPLSYTDPEGLCPCGDVAKLLQLARGDRRDWSQGADRSDVNKAFGEGTYKCNLYADEQYENAGYNLPNVGGMPWSKGKYPPGAGQLSDADFKLAGWPRVEGPALPGDLVAHRGHVGIATSSRTTISATPDQGAVENNWGFRKGQEGVVIRRCSCGG